MRLVFASLVVLGACTDEGDGYPDGMSVVSSLEEGCPGEWSPTVSAASLVGKDLTVTASYGGCEATRQWACWSGPPGSGPQQTGAVLFVYHQPAGACDALQSITSTFSIAPVVDHSYFANLSTVSIFVGGQRVEWQR